MSTIGSSAAGLAVANVLTSRIDSAGAGVEPSARPVRGPSDNSSQTARPTPGATTLSSDRILASVDSGHRLGSVKGDPSNFNPERVLHEQSERIGELVDRFERAIMRIKRFLRSGDIDDPPSPTELQARMNQRSAASDTSETEDTRSMSSGAISLGSDDNSHASTDELTRLNVIL